MRYNTTKGFTNKCKTIRSGIFENMISLSIPKALLTNKEDIFENIMRYHDEIL
jgi:hypothetical protein